MSSFKNSLSYDELFKMDNFLEIELFKYIFKNLSNDCLLNDFLALFTACQAGISIHISLHYVLIIGTLYMSMSRFAQWIEPVYQQPLLRFFL